MNGKTVLITGAARGLGLATTDLLAHRGARVVMACRNLEKATLERDRLRAKLWQVSEQQTGLFGEL
jgi:NAD(P)-dependent dehydrogenase (short-subunit alcohol dehydrogenase family)